MPVLPAMTTPSGAVDPAYWYGNGAGAAGIYDPANPADTFEVLHGGVDVAQYTSGNNSLPMSVVRESAFAVALWSGFRRWEFLYARQFQNNGGASRGVREITRQVIAGLTTRFTLPWDAQLVYLCWDAFVRHDASEWDNDNDDGGPKYEFWDWRTWYDTTELTAAYAKFPHGRTSVSNPTLAAGPTDAYADPGVHAENRWRYCSRVHMTLATAHLTAGEHVLRVTGWPGIFADDTKLAKMALPCGGIGVLALR